MFRTVSYFTKTNHLQLVKPYLRSVQNLNNKVKNVLHVEVFGALSPWDGGMGGGGGFKNLVFLQEGKIK